MKRIFVIRRRRYLARAISLGFAVAVLLPTAALARYDERGTGAVVDIYATSGLTAEDVHGITAGSGYVLPAAEQKAVEQAAAASRRVGPVDRFVPKPNVTATSAASASTIDWSRIALFSALGLFGVVGLLMLVAFAGRRGIRVAHS
jgi:hypothetical protein